jgi:hypothetical protein
MNAFLPPLFGSFFGVLFAFLLNYFWHFWNDNHQKFEGEFQIKAELSSIRNNLRVGGRPHPIEPIYGADHVKEYHLFGVYGTQVAYWYRGFEKYNLKLEEYNLQLEELNYAESLGRDINPNGAQLIAGTILTKQNSMANQIDGMLESNWLKRIPDDLSNSGLTRTKFIWYLLKQDALEEPTKNKDFLYAAIDKASKKWSDQ